MEAKNQLEIEKIMKKVYYDYDNAVSYKVWVKNFALNLQHIWNEESLKKAIKENNKDTAIVIGRGPSLKNHNHLEKLRDSNFDGIIICTDGALVTTLKAGVTPEKFPNFYVVTVDPRAETIKFYDDKIVHKYGNKMVHTRAISN